MYEPQHCKSYWSNNLIVILIYFNLDVLKL